MRIMVYEELRISILQLLEKGQAVMADANLLVSAAERNDVDFLAKLERSPYLKLTHVTVNEVIGLVKNA